MKTIFKELLFNHRILVRDDNDDVKNEDSLCTLMSLAYRFGIRITKGAQLASPNMIPEAAEFLGEYVPEPFYRGFPKSVRAMTTEQKLFDQLYHYTQTYGNGWFDEPGHSVNEEIFDRLQFSEKTKAKDFIILDETEATVKLKGILKDLLKSSRPLNLQQTSLVLNGYWSFGNEIIPDVIPCKRTIVELLYPTKEMKFTKGMNASDVIKLVEHIQYTQYGSDKLNKLNFHNKDRKFVSCVLDNILTPWNLDRVDMDVVFEKRKTWCGLLHHIHYQPKNVIAEAFVHDIRSKDVTNASAYSEFERLIKIDRAIAARQLKHRKGTGALIRNLNYILSRCEDEHETEEVLACLK